MSSPRREKYHCSVFDHDSYLEGSGSWRKEARKKKMKSEIRKLGMDREEGKKKGKTDEKERKKEGTRGLLVVFQGQVLPGSAQCPRPIIL